MDICIDFDGTCVTHEFPKVGKEIGAVSVLNKITDAGHNIILFTMRSDIEEVTSDDYNIHKEPGDYLTDAINWFIDNHIPLHGVNTNPTQHKWTKSPKAYGQLYIDDAALGCPLTFNKTLSDRPFVDWVKVEEMLKTIGVLSYSKLGSSPLRSINILDSLVDENGLKEGITINITVDEFIKLGYALSPKLGKKINKVNNAKDFN